MEYKENEVLQYIEENDVKFIKLFFTDIFGTTKSISAQPGELRKAFRKGISFDASAVKGFLNASTSDLFIVPEAATLSVLPWRPQHGRVVRFFCDIRNPDGTEFSGDSRLILKHAEAHARRLGYDINIGTECEFYLFLLDETGEPTRVPHDKASYCDLAPLDKGENVRREICITLEQMGIIPETSHHETGPGQHEVDFKPSLPLHAADNLATFKTVVRTVAARNGLFASFSPKPLGTQNAGSGLHINLSLMKDGVNLFDGTDLQDAARSFIAGILARIEEITLFLNPLAQSYERFGCFEAPKFISWSRQNRSQLIRIPAAESESARIELRSPDPSCNPYLALALVIEAGLDGIERRLPLAPSTDVNLFSAEHQELKSSLRSLPSSLREAAKLAKDSAFVKRCLPQLALDTFVGEKASASYHDPAFWEI